MNKVYSDGSYDHRSGLGAYCIVILALGVKDYYVEDCDTLLVEHEGLFEAINVAGKLKATNGEPTEVFCDSVSAIKLHSDLAHEKGVVLKHIPGHLLGKDDVVIDDHVKFHHWADTMAGIRVKNRLDTNNISSVKSVAKGTTK